MNNDWQKVKIGDLCEVGRGSSPRPITDPRYFEGGTIPWIKIADATKSGKYLYETKEKVNEFGASFSRLLPKGSLIMATSGTLGYPQFLGVDGCIHDGWLYLSNFRNVDKDFLYYVLINSRDYFYNVAYGVAIQNVNTMILRDMEIKLPPFPIQERIGGILSAYDDLIENNTRRIQILEEMAQAIYREWFVHFRFPGHEGVRMVESEMGEIPEGWQKSNVGSICQEIRRNVLPENVDPGTPYFGLEHLPRKSLGLSQWGTAKEVQSTKLAFKKDEILFGKIRPYFHKVGPAPVDGVCSSDTIVIRPLVDNLFGLTLMTVFSDDFVAQATQSSQGTKMPRANWDILKNYPVSIPPEKLLLQFDEMIRNIVDLIQNMVLRNRNLRQQRDLLLPRLVSGELDVSSESLLAKEE